MVIPGDCEGIYWIERIKKKGIESIKTIVNRIWKLLLIPNPSYIMGCTVSEQQTAQHTLDI